MLRASIFLMAVLTSGFDVLAVAKSPIPATTAFAIEIAPSTADWRYFHQMLPARRAKLWQSQVRAGKTWANWAWGWRLAWTQACIDDSAAYCRQIIKSALTDKALVVRAEAVKQIGRKYEGTADPAAIAMLAQAYGDERNSRRGKPMYVQQRILYALKQVGGTAAVDTGQHLAESHVSTKHYWQKLR